MARGRLREFCLGGEWRGLGRLGGASVVRCLTLGCVKRDPDPEANHCADPVSLDDIRICASIQPLAATIQEHPRFHPDEPV